MKIKQVEKLEKVFEAITELGNEEKRYLMSYFGITPDLKKFNKKVKDFLTAFP